MWIILSRLFSRNPDEQLTIYGWSAEELTTFDQKNGLENLHFY